MNYFQNNFQNDWIRGVKPTWNSLQFVVQSPCGLSELNVIIQTTVLTSNVLPLNRKLIKRKQVCEQDQTACFTANVG